jgi:hypothetical protein
MNENTALVSHVRRATETTPLFSLELYLSEVARRRKSFLEVAAGLGEAVRAIMNAASASAWSKPKQKKENTWVPKKPKQ